MTESTKAKKKRSIFFNPAIQLLVKYPKKCTPKYTKIFTAALFVLIEAQTKKY